MMLEEYENPYKVKFFVLQRVVYLNFHAEPERRRKNKGNVVKFFQVCLLFSMLACRTNDEFAFRRVEIEFLIEKERYLDAKSLLEESLSENPYDEDVLTRIQFVNRKLFERGRKKRDIWASPQIDIGTSYNDRFSKERALEIGPNNDRIQQN